MTILGYIVYGIGVLVTLSWLGGIRLHTIKGEGVSGGTVNVTVLFVVSLVIVPIFQFSPLHLLWMFPISVLFGILLAESEILSLPGYYLWKVMCLGIDTSNMVRWKIYGLTMAQLHAMLFSTNNQSQEDE